MTWLRLLTWRWRPDFHRRWHARTVRVKRGPWKGVKAQVDGTYSSRQEVWLAWPGNDRKDTVIRMWFRVADVEKVPS